MPLNAACYVPAPIDKIFGVYGAYIYQFNATTGQREAGKILVGPCEPTGGICWHVASGSLYVSTWNSMANQYEFQAHPLVDIFPVNPVTLSIGAGLGWSTIYQDGGRMTWPAGPRALMDFGTSDIYFIGAFTGTGATWLGKINPVTPLFQPQTVDNLRFWCDQASSDGTKVYFVWSFFSRVRNGFMNLAPDEDVTFTEVGVVMPVAIEHCFSDNKQYVVCGNNWMARINTWAPDNYTLFNLDTVNSGSDPFRIRYRSTDGRLYIPCMTNNGIIVWNPGTDSGIFKSGFTSPIDVVFTPSKAFAVQGGPVGLREIT